MAFPSATSKDEAGTNENERSSTSLLHYCYQEATKRERIYCLAEIIPTGGFSDEQRAAIRRIVQEELLRIFESAAYTAVPERTYEYDFGVSTHTPFAVVPGGPDQDRPRS